MGAAALADSQEQLQLSKQLLNYETDGPKTHAGLSFVPSLTCGSWPAIHDICRA